MDAQNLAWVRATVTRGIRPGWSDTIRSIEVMAPGMVSEGFLVDPPEILPLILHGLLSYLPDIEVTQVGGGYDLDEIPANYPPLG